MPQRLYVETWPCPVYLPFAMTFNTWRSLSSISVRRPQRRLLKWHVKACIAFRYIFLHSTCLAELCCSLTQDTVDRLSASGIWVQILLHPCPEVTTITKRMNDECFEQMSSGKCATKIHGIFMENKKIFMCEIGL